MAKLLKDFCDLLIFHNLQESVKLLADELGRTEKSIRVKLTKLGMIVGDQANTE